MVGQVERSMEATLGAVPAARQMVDDVGGLSSSLLDDARLVVTELVANAVRHGEAAAQVGVSLRWADPTLRIEVRSEGPFVPPPADRPGEDSGRGLTLVQALSRRWGVHAGAGVMVWAELHAPTNGRAHG
jgi:anti-sigma regulatory factor (Ser/Thr protein kinase)